MTPAQLEILLEISFYVGLAVLFSFCRTLADSRDSGARGRALLWLVFVNCVAGLAGGLLCLPIGDLMNMNRSLRLLLAALIGWLGLSTVMKLLEIQFKRRFPNGSADSEGPGDVGSSRVDSPPDGV